jgi:hypothetical protein
LFGASPKLVTDGRHQAGKISGRDHLAGGAVGSHTVVPFQRAIRDEKAFSGSILRVFEARAKRGCADSLAKKFATTSVDVVGNQPGNQGHFFGKSVSDEDDVFLFVSVWRDLNAVKTRFGDDWESSFLPPRYSELIEECSVKHFALRTDWHSGE